MQNLTEAEELELLALLEAQYGGESLDAFIRRVAPREPPPEHIGWELLPALERAGHRPVRLLVSMPPRHAKSMTIMRALIWHMQRNPSLLNAYVAYGSEQAETQSRWMRNVAADAGLRLADDTKAVNLWRTPQGGGLVATGVMGRITGLGVKGWLVIDDPHKDRVEAESPVIRERVWDQFQGTFYNRLEDFASVIVVATRWHEDDLIGRIKRGDTGEEWQVIEMPAIRNPVTGQADDGDDGVALWPERFPLERLRTIRRTSGEYNWASLYQQRPRPRGLSLFKEPARFSLATTRLDGYRLIWAVDPAATAKTSADYSVAVLLAVKGYGDDAIAYVLDVVRAQEEIPTFVRRVAALARKRGCGVVAESVAGFKAVPQMLRDIAPGLRVLEVKPTTDKFTRSQVWSAAWNSGRVRVPDDAPWAVEYIAEHLAFTGQGDAHDDQVDASVHGYDALYVPVPKLRGARAAPFLPFG